MGTYTKSLLATILLCATYFTGFSTAWTTVAAGSISALGNWTNGSTSPTTFATPGDTWTIIHPMTISSTPWTVGTPSSAAVTVTLAAGGNINGSGGGIQVTLNIYGNLSLADTIYVNGGACKLTLNVFGNFSVSGTGSAEAVGGASLLLLNINGNLSMTNGSLMAQGGGAIDTINVKGNFSVTGPAYITSIGGGATGVIFLSLPSSAGTMMIDNTSTGSWGANNVYVNANCTAQLAGNFSTNTGGSLGLTVNGTLICPAPHTVNGTSRFTLKRLGTLMVGHAGGINPAITTSGIRTFNDSANYGFNGTVAQVTGTDMPAALKAPDSIIVFNPAGVTLSQNTSTTGKLVFINGILNTGTFTMTVPGALTSVAGAAATSYVKGTLIKPITGLTAVNYEVGDTNYAPMELTLSAAGTAGSFGLKATNGLHPNVSTSGFASTHIANHYWTITNLSAAGPVTVIPKATYNLADILGGSNTYFRTQQYAGSAWLGSALATTNTSSPYTSTPTTGIALASIAGDYIYGRISGPTLNTIATTAENGRLNLFPNPNNGMFTLNVSSVNEEEVHVVITNVVGKKVKEFTTTTNKATEVALEDVPGVYLLSASGKQGRYVRKFVVE